MTHPVSPEPIPDLPADLLDLRRRYQQLPPHSVRWKTHVGRDFLKRIEQATIDYPVRIVAEALDTTHQAIYYMRCKHRFEDAEAWPRDEELRDFRAAWRVVEARHAACQQVRRNSREFEAVYLALAHLSLTFSFTVITKAVNVKARDLRRFQAPPLNSLAEVTELATLTNLYRQLPRRLRLGRPVVITPEFTTALNRASHSVSITKIARALDMDVTAIERILGESGRISS